MLSLTKSSRSIPAIRSLEYLAKASIGPGYLHNRIGLRSHYALRMYSSGSSPLHGTSKKPNTSIVKKISSATTFAFYSGVILVGVGALGLVVYYFVSELLLPTSDVQLFNKTFSILKKDPQCQEILGGKMQAHGETLESGSKWARTRPLAVNRGFDRHGREHVIMQFHVQSEKVEDALVRLEMVRDPYGSNAFEYRYLVLEVPGESRIYLIDNTPNPSVRAKNTGFLGVKWGKKQGDEEQ